MKKSSKSRVQMVVALLICTLFSVGCGKKEVVKDKIVVATNSESGSLDPAGMIATTYLAYSTSALDELLTYDAQGNIEYRAAKSHEVNADATVWTFHLREEAKWSDATPVTAGDFLNTIRRSLLPESGNGYANYLFPIQNAEAIYNGTAGMDTLGVKTPDRYTIEFTLSTPCVYFLDLLRLPVYTPSCEKYADTVGSGWDKIPETSVANGPFYLEQYVPEQYFTLKKNPYYWNADAVKLQRITYRFFHEQQAMTNAYKTGEVDVASGLPASVMEEYKGKNDLAVTEKIATRYLYMNLAVEPLEDERVRKAMNLALNREELCMAVGEDTEPTFNLVAKYMKDKATGKKFVEGAKMPFEENEEEARRLLAEAGYPDGKGFPVLTYSYPSLEMDSDTAQVLKQQLKKALNIDINLEAQELQVNYSQRRSGNFELCRMNWTADFADPYTYLSMLLSNSTYNCSSIADAEYDTLIAKADTEKDANKRSELLHLAEQRAVGEQFYIVPLFAMKECSLIRPDIKGIRPIAASGALEYRYAFMEK